MRIGLIVPGGIHPSGTREVIPALLSLVERLARRHDVRVLVLGHSREPIHFRLHGAQIEDVGQRLDARLRIGAFFRHGFDVLHAFWAQRPGLVAAIAGRATGSPVVVSIGGGELVWLDDIRYGGRGTRKGRAIADLALRSADRITAGSRYATKHVPILAPVEWLPLGAERDRFFAPVDRVRAPGAPFHLLHVGDRNRVKDPWTLLEAIRIVATRFDVRLEWAGVDTLDGAVERRARDLGLASRIAFAGWIEHGALPPLFRRAEVYVQASRYESQGVAVLEAALAGLPIAGTAVGLVAELAPSAAIAVPPGDPERLGAAIMELLGSAEKRRVLGSAAQRFAIAHDADWTASRFESIYEALARGR